MDDMERNGSGTLNSGQRPGIEEKVQAKGIENICNKIRRLSGHPTRKTHQGIL
jgi:hypothetical protein